jgi:hypothetical protein
MRPPPPPTHVLMRPPAPPTHVATPGGRMGHFLHAVDAMSDAERIELRRRVREKYGELAPEASYPPLEPLPKAP